MAHSRQNARSLTVWTACVLGAVALLLLLRVVALKSPVMSGDEYAYLTGAQMFPDPGVRFARDPILPRVYNPVFAACGRLLFAVSDRPELVMKGLNVAMFVGAALLFVGLIRKIGGRSPMAAAVIALLPISSYTAYFMPEAMYVFLFALLTWAVVGVVPRHMLAGAFLAGVLNGALLLVKPHAIALFAVVLLTLGVLAGTASSKVSRRIVAIGAAAFVASTYASLVFLNWTLTGRFECGPLLFVGEFYGGYLSQGMSFASWLGRARLLIGILAGHLIVFVALLAPAIAVSARELWRILAAIPEERDARSRTSFVLVVFGASVTLCALAMTVNFTGTTAQMLPAEHLRLYGRYYTFVFPVYLTAFFAFAGHTRASSGDGWVRAGAAAGLVASALLVYLQRTRVIYPFDYPEAFAFSAWHGQPRSVLVNAILSYTGIIVALASYSWLLWRGRRALLVYPAFLLAVFAIGNVAVAAWQHAASVENAALVNDGQAMRRTIPAEEVDEGLVVGPEWNGPLASFLFNFRGSPRVVVRPPGSTLVAADLPAGARWVLMIGRYETAFPHGDVVDMPAVRLVRLKAE